MKICEIFDFLNSLYPVETAEDFDNVGLLVGSGENEVTACIVALDCTKSAIETAVERGANLIITHHPVIFEPLKSLSQNSIPALCIKNGVSVISMHTNLDKGLNGVNDALCSKLGLCGIERFSGYDMYPLFKGQLKSEMSEEAFVRYLKDTLGGSVRYNSTGKTIKTVAVCSGSGGRYVFDAIKCGCDAFVTADVKHDVFIDAQNENFPVFDAGHFHTEDVIVEPLTQILKAEFPTVSFVSYHGYKVKTVM